MIEETFDVNVSARNGGISLTGEEDMVMRVSDMFLQFNELLESGLQIETVDLKFAIKYFRENTGSSLKDIFSKEARIKTDKKTIVPRSVAQCAYIYSLTHSDIVISIGPAGTGKTYLAMAVAVSELLSKKVARIVLTRPAVEAGESLGFLPGDLKEKITPYLRPLYDALYSMLEPDKLHAMMDSGQIEVAPLAYMRGRTLNDSFIVLDEAQNCTSEQMKMFLTRLGADSKAAITGDITQIDLPKGRVSGLVEAKSILADVEGIDFVYFSKRDVVRHSLVEKIISAYEGRANENGRDS